MAERTWHASKIRYCEHVGLEVALETEVVYPAEHLPEQAPRVLAHRCTKAIECNLVDKMACGWSATNPEHYPL
jgi:hypothetical protein